MKTIVLPLAVALAGCILFTRTPVLRGATPAERIARAAATGGLIAFWDFQTDGKWTSRYDKRVIDRALPAVLRRIGDPNSYTPDQWPYTDESSRIVTDTSGPFGGAIRFNQGYIFAEVPRDSLEGTPLDLCGQSPFTLIAWGKFIGKRHFVAGIWDEGGWDKYGGRRQAALFGGLFGSAGLIAHISATGAASYPQSTHSGSQYARCAIDGRSIANGQWVAMAMTFDPATGQVTALCDGRATPTQITDPVANDVFAYRQPLASNPYRFPWPVYSPTKFILKFNGYNARQSGVFEHWLQIDTQRATVAYGRSVPEDVQVAEDYRVQFDVRRGESSLLKVPVVFAVPANAEVQLPVRNPIEPGDAMVTSLEVRTGDAWQRVGTEIHYAIRTGAPFTFGRTLGLGAGEIEHGTQFFLDGVAVFNRVLGEAELQNLSFAERTEYRD